MIVYTYHIINIKYKNDYCIEKNLIDTTMISNKQFCGCWKIQIETQNQTWANKEDLMKYAPPLPHFHTSYEEHMTSGITISYNLNITYAWQRCKQHLEILTRVHLFEVPFLPLMCEDACFFLWQGMWCAFDVGVSALAGHDSDQVLIKHRLSSNCESFFINSDYSTQIS